MGYKRCWGQKSTDHRGDTSFPGLVCTLLSDAEVRDIIMEHTNDEFDYNHDNVNVCEGLVYTIPQELVSACLEELDFREKGGYARDIIDVIVSHDGANDGETTTKTTIQAMLYRGTPTNPAFSNRALLDELYAAAIMSVAIGPSGKNDAYLYQLDTFLSNSKHANKYGDDDDNTSTSTSDNQHHVGDSLTGRLTTLAKTMQEHQLYFIFGSGSNQYNQLLLESSTTRYNNAAQIVDGECAHELKEIVLVVPKGREHIQEKEDGVSAHESAHRPKRLFAGGGHSALLTHAGDFYLWGWNEARQLGRGHQGGGGGGVVRGDDLDTAHPIVPPLDIKVETAALGHNHTLIIEKDTGFLYSFGDDQRGQVSGGGSASGSDSDKLTKLDFGTFVDVSAGLFHSAGITRDGELVTFGCGRFGQSLYVTDEFKNVGRWRPDDGSRLVKVACGRRHTVVLDEFGRVYTMGENKYNQLGRLLNADVKDGGRDQKMGLVDGILGQKGSGCVGIDSGWSHTIALVEADTGASGSKLYGWGRNDKSQLGFDSEESTIPAPRQLQGDIVEKGVKAACCGAESISVLDSQNDISSCGWNEHGNLGIGHAKDVSEFNRVSGARICSPHHADSKNTGTILMASGGAHFLATIVK